MEHYFAQFTDLHVGSPGFVHEIAERNFSDALKELDSLKPKPGFVLVTADLVSAGNEQELRRYCEIAKTSTIPLYPTPANHDLWGDQNAPEIWKKLIGDLRYQFDYAGARFFLMDEYEKFPGKWYEGWRARVREDHITWLKNGLQQWSPGPTVLVFHSPILPLGNGDYADVWHNSNVNELLELISQHNFLGIITGHWHRNMEWTLPLKDGRSIPLISTGTLMGQQWTGIPPYHWFPTRPGYKLFCISNQKLHSFWKELRIGIQVNLVWVGPVHTQGPRPQVRPPIIYSKVNIIAQGWAKDEEIVDVEFSVGSRVFVSGYQTKWKVSEWSKMRKVFDALWSDWEGEFNPTGIEPGEYALIVRAESNSGKIAYDSVPILISNESSSVSAKPGFEQVFEMFYLPVE